MLSGYIGLNGMKEEKILDFYIKGEN